MGIIYDRLGGHSWPSLVGLKLEAGTTVGEAGIY